MFTCSKESDIDKIIENSTRYNKGRPVQILLDATVSFDRIEKPDHKEVESFKELFYALISKTSQADKRQISIVLARNVFTPRSIALFLAMEDATISAPILLYSPLISEVDMVTLSEKCPSEALRVLARRDGLTESVVRAIVARRDTLAMKLLQQNPSIPADVLHNLLPEQVVNPVPVPTEPKQAGTSDESKRVQQKRREIMELASKGGKLPKQEQKTVSGIYADSSTGTSGSLVKAARTGNKVIFFNELSAQLSLGPAHLRKYLLEDPNLSMSAALKALQIPTGIASQIMLLMDPEIGASLEKLRLFMKKYNDLDADTCANQFIQAGAKFHAISRPAPRVKKRAPVSTTNPETSFESELAGALRERRQFVLSNSSEKQFGRRHHAA